ncbi:MAG TPA: ADP-ribosylglycohydrolase family protein, partial [Candidatus Deferrimicrobiaceae bacterium]
LRRFHADRPALGLSYEVLRQVVYTGRVPRPETLFRILGTMQFSPGQIQKICGMHYGDYLPIPPPVSAAPPATPATSREPAPGERNLSGEDATRPDRGRPEQEASGSFPEDPGEILSRLRSALPQLPVPGNEDIWEMAQTVARIAEQKVRRAAARQAEQPLLFAGEPEAVYQFLVRKGRIPPFLSRGEGFSLGFVEGIDYRDRYAGALLGAAVGDAMGAVTQGLTARDIQELYGEVDSLPEALSARGASVTAPGSLPLAVAASLLPDGVLDPARIALALAREVRREDPPGLAGFARNILERGLPWHEAGEGQPEGAPAVHALAIALLRAGSIRRLKLEAGILAAITHPHPAAIAATIAMACATAKVLHSQEGTLDVLSFPRALAPVVAGMEPERGGKPRSSRPPATVGRRLGAELPALLLRRAPVSEMREALGNGPAPHEGAPFALGCFLRSPGDFTEGLLQAVNQGGDARAVAAMTGALCGAYVGASGIPGRFLERLPGKGEFEGAAEALLALARRDG